ncbi:hypothetical protein BV25DRAFT_72864 [Artomyces pyxidatus]|uniref:Uncharacterized protein n=1 Tax=Artomyces pyxidatus TaxID=48021 RepID=A0ACB8TKN2_9AGAM|nr:hypothetical protein BV25DRAFT_72864 [Artomyces pyxidatus]
MNQLPAATRVRQKHVTGMNGLSKETPSSSPRAAKSKLGTYQDSHHRRFGRSKYVFEPELPRLPCCLRDLFENSRNSGVKGPEKHCILQSCQCRMRQFPWSAVYCQYCPAVVSYDSAARWNVRGWPVSRGRQGYVPQTSHAAVAIEQSRA